MSSGVCLPISDWFWCFVCTWVSFPFFLTKSYLHRHCVIHSHKSEGLIFDSHRLTCWCIHLRCITRSTTTPHKTFYLHFLAACPHWNHHKRQEFRVTFAKHRREFTDIWDCLSSRNICMWFALQFMFCVVFFLCSHRWNQHPKRAI